MLGLCVDTHLVFTMKMNRVSLVKKNIKMAAFVGGDVIVLGGLGKKVQSAFQQIAKYLAI